MLSGKIEGFHQFKSTNNGYFFKHNNIIRRHEEDSKAITKQKSTLATTTILYKFLKETVTRLKILLFYPWKVKTDVIQ